MAKESNKLTDDTIKAQWSKNNSEHSKLWNAVGHLGEEVGMAFDGDGNVTFREDRVSVAPQPTIDEDMLRSIIASAIKENMPKIDTDIHIKNNQEVFTAVTEVWDSWIDYNYNMFLKANKIVNDMDFGEGMHAYKLEPDADMPATPQCRTSHKNTVIQGFLKRLWADMVSTFWKAFAYSLAICCALGLCYQYYQNRKLLSLANEYAVVRSVIEQDPNSKELIKKINTILDGE